ncbi:geraniol 8-hydroxylase-like [Panicum miliaceum]|uniref:Geraniol 8-hydroxylase-like n=1 Tax=Panicum miliaceum TaxID=4540 RepID=A0A3L6TDM3_PANMI|nr:geraniol 8-hydroxylase-like [Panicum miliaceum]
MVKEEPASAARRCRRRSADATRSGGGEGDPDGGGRDRHSQWQPGHDEADGDGCGVVRAECALCAVTGALVECAVRQLLADRRRQLRPGPTPLPFIGNLLDVTSELPHHRSLARLARRHGPLMTVRLGTLVTVVASSPSTAREVLQTHNGGLNGRSPPDAWLALGHAANSVFVLPPGRIGASCSRWAWTTRRRARCTTPRGRPWRALSLKPNVSDFFLALAAADLQGVRRRFARRVAMVYQMIDEQVERRMRGRREAGGGSSGEKDLLDVMLDMSEQGKDDGVVTVNRDVIRPFLTMAACRNFCCPLIVDWLFWCDKALASTEDAPGDSPTQTQRGCAHEEDKTLASIAHATGGSSTKTQKSATKKRSHPSPNKNVAKKLFTGEEGADGSGGNDSGAATSDQNSEAHADFVSTVPVAAGFCVSFVSDKKSDAWDLESASTSSRKLCNMVS